MKRIISLLVLNLVVSLFASAQNTNHTTFRIMNVTPNGVKISGKIKKQYDTFNEIDKIQWLTSPASMVVSPLTDMPNKYVWYKGVSRKMSAGDVDNGTDLLFWWIKFNKSSAKGSINFNQEFLMYGNELIIELPEVLKEGEGYEFVSLETGKSFGCKKEDQKPLIMITKDMLDSVGFNGKSIRLKVLYHNYYNQPKVVSESMIITNL